MDAPPREAFDGTSLSKQSLSREIAMGRIREALEKAGIRATQAGYAHG